MVNKKLKVEKPSDLQRAVFKRPEDKGNAFEPEGMFLRDYSTFSEHEICKKEQKHRRQPEESFGFHGSEADHSGHLVNALLLREFADQGYVSSQHVETAEHFADHSKHASKYMELARDVSARDQLNQTALHLAVKHARDNPDMLECLLHNHGHHVDAVDLHGRTALHVASSRGDLRSAELLLRHGANPLARTHDDHAPILLAVQSGCTGIVELLVRRGCDVNELVVDPYLNRKYSYLHCAVERNHAMMVETLLRCKADVNQRDCYGSTALHLASRNGRTDIVRILLNHGAHVHERDHNDLSALYHAVDGGHTDVFELLLLNGADLDDRGTSGASLLHLAVKRSEHEFIEALLARGANVNASTRFGQTPLHYAVADKNWRALELLLRHGADVNRREMLGKTALHAAIETRRKEAYEALLSHGADVNARDNTHQTPLHSAVRQGCPETVRLLLLRGADVNAEDETRQTPLHFAVKFGYVHLFEQLTLHGVNVNAADADGQTALHLAVLHEYSKLLYQLPDHTFFARLLSFGADVHGAASGSETPLHLAVRKRCGAFVRRLLRRGAEVDAPEPSAARTPLHLAVENGDGECTEQLLTYGAAVERLDAGGKTPIDVIKGCPAVTRAFVRHFIRRSVAGFRVSAKLMKMDQEDEEMRRYREQCTEEVGRMAATRLYDAATFYDFLRGGRRSLVGFVQQSEVVTAFEQGVQRAAFPAYADLLERNFHTGQRYQRLLEPADARLGAVCRYQLPSVPLEKILGYLNDRDMKRLVDAVPCLQTLAFETKASQRTT